MGLCVNLLRDVTHQSNQGMVLYARLYHRQELRNTAPDAACPIASPFMDAASAFAASDVQLYKGEAVRKLLGFTLFVFSKNATTNLENGTQCRYNI